jgi:hypothetical protein
VVVGLVATALVVAALAWHLSALGAYDASGRPGPTASRLASAQLAAKLEPWNERFTWRLVGLRGLALFEEGKVQPAYFLLERYMPIVFGRDAAFIDIYHRVRDAEMSVDSGKPHVAHGLDPYNNFTTTSTAPVTYTTGSGTPY